MEARGRYWREHLMFRDHLRKHPGTAAQYTRLKRVLAERFRRRMTVSLGHGA